MNTRSFSTKQRHAWLRLSVSTACFPVLLAAPGWAQTAVCEPAGGSCPGPALSQIVPALPQPNTDGEAPAELPDGFVITLDGETLDEDPELADVVRRTDVQLADADVAVVFDGLGAVPRLDLEVVGEPRAFDAGETAELQSQLNYPAYVVRGEVRLIDMSAPGGPRTLDVIPVDPNGSVSVVIPTGRQIVAVHRVYDARGRFDETYPVPLTQSDTRNQTDGVEDGVDNRSRSRIPVHGGAVTVRGSSVTPGAQVTALGETVRPDPSGGFVLQRILPPGEYGIDVRVTGPGQNLDLVRQVEIPRSEWFTTGSAEVTLGWRDRGAPGDDFEHWNSARLAFYIDGRTANGVSVTAQADTGEGDIDDLFNRLDDLDPRNTVQRIDPFDLYPTYGDDSIQIDNTPTSGRIYLRVERDGNFLQWGDFDAGLDGGYLVRNDRTLYGAQGFWASPDTTARGEARASVLAYGASPELLSQRDVFLGTGGSVYVLQRQDVAIATEVISVEIRDPVNSRLLDTVRLEPGRDYDINYLQGIVTLAGPLSSRVDTDRLIVTPDEEPDLQLVVQYEFFPGFDDVDGFSLGGRGEVWLTDDVRLGVSGISEDAGGADQTLVGVDLQWRIGANSEATLEYAQSDGPGFGSSFSADGGFVFDSVGPVSGSGSAFRADLQLDFADIGLSGEGVVGGYAERREEGFSNLDFNITDTTGTEELWGVFIEATPREGFSYAFFYDDFRNEAGERDRSGGAEVEMALSDRVSLGVGLEYIDRDRFTLTSGTDNGSRTDIGARLTYELGENQEVYVFGQGSIQTSGLEDNDRIGAGLSYEFDNGWTIDGEVSGGTTGPGTLVRASYSDGAGSTRYIGYEIDPGRTLAGVTLEGRDRGTVVAGLRQRVNGQLTYFGENTFDMFGRYRSLTTAYGLTYEATEFLSYTAAVEFGDVDDRFENDFDRTAISLGARYETDMISAGARIEYRTEDGLRSGLVLDSDTYVLTADARYIINDNQRVLMTVDGIATDTDESSILNGDFLDFTAGYAYRPVDTDRLNVLLRYRFLFDDIGQRIDDTDSLGPRQRSHVVSADASYLVNENWRLGSRVGFRLADTAATDGADFVDNNAWIATLNARYHFLNKWDALVEFRTLNTVSAGGSEIGVLGAISRQIGTNFAVDAGYNFTNFSDDLTDLTRDDRGLFLNFRVNF